MAIQDSRTAILFISHAYYNRGGVETHLKTLSGILAETHACYILFPENDALILVLDGKEIQKISIPPFSILNPKNNARAEALVMAILKQVRPTVVHVMHFLGWPLNLFEVLRESAVPFVLSFHDYYSLTPAFTLPDQDVANTTSKEHALKYFAKDISAELKNRRTFLQGAFGYAKARIVPSQYLLNTLEAIFPGEYTIIPYGIKPFEVKEVEESKGTLRVGYLGSLIPQKGWQMLLQAFTALYAKRQDIELHVFGGANEAVPSVPGVRFHGAFDQKDLSNIMPQFDLAIIPSTFAETYSIVLSELWFAKKPVIAANIGALGTRIEDGVNGRLFEAGNAKDLEKVLENTINSKEWLEWQIPTPYSASEMKAAFLKLYSSILS